MASASPAIFCFMNQRVPVAAALFLELPGGPDLFNQEVQRWWRFIDWVEPGSSTAALLDKF